MQRLQNEKGALTPIEKGSFKLEKDIQALIESNMETLFGLDFVSSEFAVAGFRPDSLAYDEQNNSFVVVEYKKGRGYSPAVNVLPRIEFNPESLRAFATSRKVRPSSRRVFI